MPPVEFQFLFANRGDSPENIPATENRRHPSQKGG